MKKIISGIILVLFLAFFVACNSNSRDSDDTGPSDIQINFDVQIIRHGNMEAFDPTFNPIITVVSSMIELEQYHEFACPCKFYSVVHYPCAFLQAIAGYNDAFFTENYLAFVMLFEGSGSIRHEVERIEGSGNIIINRLLPEPDVPMTTDIAIWNIVIELNRNFQPEQFNVVFVDKIVS